MWCALWNALHKRARFTAAGFWFATLTAGAQMISGRSLCSPARQLYMPSRALRAQSFFACGMVIESAIMVSPSILPFTVTVRPACLEA